VCNSIACICCAKSVSAAALSFARRDGDDVVGSGLQAADQGAPVSTRGRDKFV
jgi:hypothetical protein